MITLPYRECHAILPDDTINKDELSDSTNLVESLLQQYKVSDDVIQKLSSDLDVCIETISSISLPDVDIDVIVNQISNVVWMHCCIMFKHKSDKKFIQDYVHKINNITVNSNYAKLYIDAINSNKKLAINGRIESLKDMLKSVTTDIKSVVQQHVQIVSAIASAIASSVNDVKLYKSLLSEHLRDYDNVDVNIQLSELSKLISLLDNFDQDYRLKSYQNLITKSPCVSSIPILNDSDSDGNDNDNDDDNDDDNSKIIPSEIESYDITTMRYWMKYSKYINIVSLSPQHYPIGLVLPPSTRVPLPVIYSPVAVFNINNIITVIFITINGIVISPAVLTIDGNNNMQSKWKSLLKGSTTINNNGGSTVAFGSHLIQQSGVTVDPNIDITKSLPMDHDDYPPFNRMGMHNAKMLEHINAMCSSAKSFLGL